MHVMMMEEETTLINGLKLKLIEESGVDEMTSAPSVGSCQLLQLLPTY